ncbi:MAG TPA: carbonic anhydrase [Candidatus Acidoferrales bacterium]|nr:carbonic anhydrase [Candidatus Acidoferrales bacterium]
MAGLGLGAAFAGSPLAAAAAGAGPARGATTPAGALEELVSGDARFTAGTPANCGSQTGRMAKLGEGQNPHAIILSCSDSRVPNDTIFDQRPGNIFGVRIAGNYVTNDGLGSMEYGVAVLKALVIVVLGHSGCGAVKAALGFVKDGTTVPGHIQDVVAAVAPAAKATKGQPGDWLDNAIAENVRMNVKALTARSQILSDAEKNGTIKIVGGVYNIGAAKVTFLS